MNKTYRNIWNAATGTWTAVAETAKSHSKGTARAARQAVVALALGGASVGGAFAADACTTADGASGTLDAAGVCKAKSVIGTQAIGTMAGTNSYEAGTGASAPSDGGVAVGVNASAGGLNSTAIGFRTSASGEASTTVGMASTASGYHSAALGVGAIASGRESVALGVNSATDRDNSVSVGNATTSLTRQITNVAAGTNATDAVNLGQMNTALATKVDNTYVNVRGTTTAAVAAGTQSIAIGDGAIARNSTSGPANIAVGAGANTAGGAGQMAFGQNASVQTSGAGGAIAIGRSATTTARGVALGDGASVTSYYGVALGDTSVADRTNSVSVGNATTSLTRQITNVTAGTQNTDAVNLGQMNAALAPKIDDTVIKVGGTNAATISGNTSNIAIGSGATSYADQANSPAIAMGWNSNANGAGAIAIGSNSTASASETIALGLRSTASGANSMTLGGDAKATEQNSVALGYRSEADRENAVSVGSSAQQRNIIHMAAGRDANDAVNVSQLAPVVTALGGGAAIDTTTGAVTGPTYNLTNGGPQTTVGGALGALDQGLTTANGNIAQNTADITTINNQLGDLASGTIGIVQQAGAGADITVGANTDGAAVDFTGTAGARKLTGVAAGDVSAASNEAINGSQLHGVSESVASAIGGTSTVNPDGTITAPSFTVGDGNGGTTTVHNVGDAVTNLDGRVTNNEGDIANLADQIGSGTVGLVQQANAGADITVGANTDGAAVNFTGTAGDRKLTGVAAGDVSASSNEAVNGSQLHGVADSVASAIGAGSTVNPDGTITAPSFTVGDGNGGTTTVHNVGDVVTNLDGRVTNNEGAITHLGDQLASGQIGLVQQDLATGTITVGANVGGSTVNFAGTGGARTLTGVANGVNDSDAVTIAQLKATGLIDYTGKEIAAVTYDDISLGSVTFGGSAGTALHNVAPGLIAAGSMDAVNGGQLHDLQQQFAQQYGQLSGQMNDLTNRVGDLETAGGGSGGGMGPGTGTGGDGSLVVGDGSNASGSNSTAVGQGAVASGDNGSAFGQGSNASGENSSAIGQGSVASGSDSTAIGQGSSATGNGSVALGQGSVADRDNAVSVGSAGNERQITNVADGTAPTDAVNVRQLDSAMQSVDQRFGETNRMINDVAKNAYAGVAAAMAMPNLTPSQPGKTVVAVGAANYKSGSAVAAGATYRTRDGKWLMNGALSVTSTGDAGVRAQVGYEF